MLLPGTKNSFTTRGLEDASLILTAQKWEAEGGRWGRGIFKVLKQSCTFKDQMKYILHFYCIGSKIQIPTPSAKVFHFT